MYDMDVEDFFLRAPPLMTFRDAQKRDTRDNIVRAAIALVSEGGEEAVTMRAVAAAVGISERTVFRHFKSRDDLLSTVWGMVEALSVVAPAQSADRLAKIVQARFEDLAANEAVVRAYLRRTTRPKATRRRDAQHKENLKSCVLDGLDGLYLDARTIRRRAAILDVITSLCAWEMLTETWGMTGKQAGKAAVEAVELLINRRLPV